MADRGTSNAPKTRNPQRPPSKPSRLDQFADDLFENEAGTELGVTSNKERRSLRKYSQRSRKQ